MAAPHGVPLGAPLRVSGRSPRVDQPWLPRPCTLRFSKRLFKPALSSNLNTGLTPLLQANFTNIGNRQTESPLAALHHTFRICTKPFFILPLRFCLRSFHTTCSPWVSSSTHRASVTIYMLMNPKFIISSHIPLSSSRVLSLGIRHFQLNIWKALKLNSFTPCPYAPPIQLFSPVITTSPSRHHSKLSL